jgi:F0F1-type ATP synthase assembly protein I
MVKKRKDSKSEESVDSIRKQLEEKLANESAHESNREKKEKSKSASKTRKPRANKTKRASKDTSLVKEVHETSGESELKSETTEPKTKSLKETETKEDLPSFLNAEKVPFSSSEETQTEAPSSSIRNAGLAWSAAIGLLSSVVFMMIIGWLVDMLLGSEPIGIVAGICIGAGIGLYQFFRITSKISD